MFGFYVYTFLMWLTFSMNGVIEIFGGISKKFRVCKYAFYLFESYRQIKCTRSIYYTVLLT